MNSKELIKISGLILAASIIMGFIVVPGYADLWRSLPTISEKYNQLGGVNGFLGAPLAGENIEPDGIGRYQLFKGGNIHWSPETGAHEVHGAILKKYASLGWETSFLGYPVTDESATPDGEGRYNHFQGGSIYISPNTEAHEVHGAIRQKWAELGWETSFLGYPVTDESATPDGKGRYNHFQGGSIYISPNTGAHEVHGDIRQRWAKLGWERSFLGYPTSDTGSYMQGRFQFFEGGFITWSPETGALDADKSTPAYSIRLNKFHIDNTRARHEDTDTVSFALKVGDQIFEPKIKNMGNANNGDHEVYLEFGPIPIKDTTPVMFNYIIVNAGHSNPEDVVNGINKIALNGLRFIPYAGQIPGLVEGMQKLSDILFTNCDGVVAQDQISVTGDTLKDWTSSNYGTYSEDRFYPGTDSPVGCGSNSKYTVTWSVTRVI